MITDMFKEEGGKLFDSRSASLGHTLQGGIPSPLDRARAVRLALKCMAFVEQQHREIMKQQDRPRTAPPEENVPEEWNTIPGARGCTPQNCASSSKHVDWEPITVCHVQARTETHTRL